MCHIRAVQETKEILFKGLDTSSWPREQFPGRTGGVSMADADSRCAVSAQSVLEHPRESLRPSQECSTPGQAPSHLSQAMSSPQSPWGQHRALGCLQEVWFGHLASKSHRCPCGSPSSWAGLSWALPKLPDPKDSLAPWPAVPAASQPHISCRECSPVPQQPQLDGGNSSRRRSHGHPQAEGTCCPVFWKPGTQKMPVLVPVGQKYPQSRRDSDQLPLNLPCGSLRSNSGFTLPSP